MELLYLCVRGVIVGPGDHRVEFAYRTPGLGAGLAVAGATWAIFALGAAVAARRRGA